MFRVTFNHALRISETLSLTKDNIVGGSLVMQRLKGSRKTVQSLLPNEKAELEELAKTDGKFFDICRKTAWLKMRKYCAEAGIPQWKATPHKLKHTAGKLGLAGGMTLPELQTYLGHVNGSNTMIYLQVDDEVASSAFAKAMGQ